MPKKRRKKAELYKRYPLRNIFVYNGVTVLHYLIGGVGIVLAYDASWPGYLVGGLYLLFAFAQMYVVMPLMVCPKCLYYRMEGSLCTSGLNLLSRKIARQGDPREFAGRGKGVFCHNNLYIAALVVPIAVVIPGMILNFSLLVLALFLGMVGLLLFRFVVIFQRTACVHCLAKKACPNAESMGLNK